MYHTIASYRRSERLRHPQTAQLHVAESLRREADLCEPLAVSEAQTHGTLQAATAKAEVQRRGIGAKSRVRVRLRDGTEVKGHISKIEENSFEVTDKKSGKTTSIRYDHASEIHRG